MNIPFHHFTALDFPIVFAGTSNSPAWVVGHRFKKKKKAGKGNVRVERFILPHGLRGYNTTMRGKAG